jgi:ribose transport system ATP-binding protein
MKKTNNPLLEVKNVSKEFPGVKALNHVDLKLFPGEVRALVGENGAGKSTLIKIISGVYRPTEGEIYLNGIQKEIPDPYFALKNGIVPVHQEVNLEPFLTVAENIFIGRQPKNNFGFIDYKMMNSEATKWLTELGIEIDPNLPLGMASIAERQMVAIARAVSLDAKVLIFDEPTSSLTQKEIDGLFLVIKRLKEKNIGIIYISHRLEEIFQVCDSITIMRDGVVVANELLKNIDTPSIIRLMIGRDLKDMYEKTVAEIGKPILEVKNLNVKGILNDISFTLRSGEIVGVSGLVGAGRTELARALFGDLPISSGQIFIDGKEVRSKTPKGFIQSGIGLIPEDRKDQGLVIDLPIKNNISMTIFRILSKFGIMNEKQEIGVAEDYVKKLTIKTPSIFQKVKFLSGGNQQRVVIAKWLATKPKILIVDEPTRGIDVGAKAEIHKLLNDLVHQGVAILMISSELPEIIAMSDRVLVIYLGRVTAELEGKKINEEKIMRYATGQA